MRYYVENWSLWRLIQTDTRLAKISITNLKLQTSYKITGEDVNLKAGVFEKKTQVNS